ncbi:MAG: hypothetical protein ABJP48_11420 [Erythrobacter sp.]
MSAQIRLVRLVASAIAFGLASPTLAQNSQQNSPGSFTLPESTPTPTPRPDVSGPVDDSGVVPLPPRVIASPTPSPSTITIPQQQPDQAPTEVNPNPVNSNPGQPAPETAPSTAPSQTIGPPASTVPSTVPSNQPSAETGETAGQAEAGVDAFGGTGAITDRPATSPTTPSTGANGAASGPAADNAESAIESTEGEKSGAVSIWLWVLAAMLLLICGVAGWFFMRQRKPLAVPKIERPKVAPATTTPIGSAKPQEPSVPAADVEPATISAAMPATLDVRVSIVSATRSMMFFTLDYEIALANRQARGLRDISVSAILTSAKPGTTEFAQDLSFDRPEPLLVERIGPSKTHSIAGQVQLPMNKLQVMRQGNKPLFVPLLQITIEQPSAEPAIHHYAVGIPSETGATRLHPIPLDTPPGSLPSLRVRELDLQPA